MQDSPRRQVLRSIGTALSIATLGSVSAAASDGRPVRSTVLDRTWADAAEFGELFDYVPASAAEDEFVFGGIDYAAMRESNRQGSTSVPVTGLDVDTDALSKGAVLQNGQSGASVDLLVLTGDVSLDGEGEVVEGPSGTEYERYERGENVVAAVDDRLVVAASTDLLTDALAAKAGDTERLLDANEAVSEGIEAFGDADTRAVMVGDEFGYGQSVDAEVRYSGYATTVRDPDTLERTLLFGLADESDTEQVAETLRADGLYGDGENTTVETDGAVVTVTTVIDLAARRRAREHDSPGGLRVDRENLRSNDEYVTVEVTDGDPTPVDELTLEVGGETYDRSVWAGDQETIAEGDTIRFRAADVEPNLEVTITHEREYGTRSSTTYVLGSLEFDFDYAFDSRTLDLEYRDTFAVDGDELSVVVFEGRQWWRRDDDDETRTETPWADETVTEGDAASLDEVDPGETVVVTYGGTEPQDGIAYFRPEPPGQASLEYDFAERTVTATLSLDEPRPATEYEVRVDDEPADTQWADAGDTVADGDSLTVEDVPVGTSVAVVWGEHDARLAVERTVPTIELDLAFGDEVSLEHVEGDAVPASKLTAHVWNDDRTLVDVGDEIDGEFAPGDSVPLGVETLEHVSLLYDDEYYVGYASARDR
ncbi:hypothetical protein [Haloarchaeobius iranensis]|uniref:S-layer protein n=1 Tax=Haloarchaeobius iranensis TaxID=996166 RepID=A0A1G9XE61_9EURY|nr:hypothetical protein [Haloarchaeobius iranensis]SDM94565.1 hypothetical protein SAMN05192554_11050 [Haloarchaeobius iranensis]